MAFSQLFLSDSTSYDTFPSQSEYSMNEDGINPLTGLYSLEFKKWKKVDHHCYCYYYYGVPA